MSKVVCLLQLRLLFLSVAIHSHQVMLASCGHFGIWLRICWVRVLFSKSIVGYICMVSSWFHTELSYCQPFREWLPGIFLLCLTDSPVQQHEDMGPSVISPKLVQSCSTPKDSEEVELEASLWDIVLIFIHKTESEGVGPHWHLSNMKAFFCPKNFSVLSIEKSYYWIIVIWRGNQRV